MDLTLLYFTLQVINLPNYNKQNATIIHQLQYRLIVQYQKVNFGKTSFWPVIGFWLGVIICKTHIILDLHIEYHFLIIGYSILIKVILDSPMLNALHSKCQTCRLLEMECFKCALASKGLLSNQYQKHKQTKPIPFEKTSEFARTTISKNARQTSQSINLFANTVSQIEQPSRWLDKTISLKDANHSDYNNGWQASEYEEQAQKPKPHQQQPKRQPYKRVITEYDYQREPQYRPPITYHQFPQKQIHFPHKQTRKQIQRNASFSNMGFGNKPNQQWRFSQKGFQPNSKDYRKINMVGKQIGPQDVEYRSNSFVSVDISKMEGSIQTRGFQKCLQCNIQLQNNSQFSLCPQHQQFARNIQFTRNSIN